MGRASDSRHRDAVFHQLSADLLRSTRDENSLKYASTRAMHRPEVIEDPVLAGMIRGVIAQCENELSARLAEQRAEITTYLPGRPSAVSPAPIAPPAAPAPLELRATHQAGFDRLRHELDEHLLRYNLVLAREILRRLETFQAAHAEEISAGMVERARAEVERVAQRQARFDQQIADLVQWASTAARRGRHDAVAQAIRRLSLIHAARPLLLPEARFKAVRDQIVASTEQFEHRQAAQALMARERAVASELKTLAEGIHRFHLACRQSNHTSPQFQVAEAQYEALIGSLRAHDVDWFADLMVELDELLEELHDNTGQAKSQVDRFLHRVRASLRVIALEARAVSNENPDVRGQLRKPTS